MTRAEAEHIITILRDIPIEDVEKFPDAQSLFDQILRVNFTPSAGIPIRAKGPLFPPKKS
jgi:hypothetical protein